MTGHMHNCKAILGLALAVLAVAGCVAPPTPPPSAAEASVDEIVGGFRQALNPITSLLVTKPGVVGWGENGRGAPSFMNDELKASVIQNVAQVKGKYASERNCGQALNVVSAELEQAVADAEAQYRWRLMMGLIEVYESLNPGTLKMARLKERAQVQLNRPEVVLKGFFVDKERNDDTYAFFHVFLHPSNEEKKVQVRKGEEFYGLRFVDIIGKRRGAILEYLAVPGQTFRVMGP